jgi:long-subunit acyl-CoA synthetase (AMP-forming)
MPAASRRPIPTQKLLRLNASREHGGEIALREKDFGLWHVFTWNDYQTRVHDFALGMVELGLGQGDVIGIIGDNRPDWVVGRNCHPRHRRHERSVSIAMCSMKKPPIS